MAKFEFFALICFLGVIAISQAGPTTRVVGGDKAYDGQFPHQISLRRSGSHTCGGSILSRNYVLTAAHCVGTADSEGNYVVYNASLFTVRAGSNDRLSGGVLVNVQSIVTHEDYGNFLNDVAVLRLSRPLVLTKNIQPIRLATKEVPSGSPVIISGWGRVKHGGDVPRELKWNTLTAISRSECKEAIRWDSDALICLAHAPNNGACNGDSGGPALYEGEVVGIAGFVYGGCGSANPDGYAKVFYHVDWIKKHAEL